MTALEIHAFAPAEWDDLAQNLAGFSLVQSWAWGEAKARTGPWRPERGLFTAEGGRVAGVFQALVRELPAGLPSGLVWINRAPLLAPQEPGRQAEELSASLASLRRHYAERRGLYLRVAPALDAGVLGPAEVRAAGLQVAGVPGWASATLDLGRSIESMRAGLAQKWRNTLNKAERLGLAVERGCDDALFGRFIEAYRGLVAARRFATSLSPELLAALQASLPPERRLEVFLARQGETFAGAVLIARYGTGAEYLAGVVAEAGRPLGAGQLLLWRAIVALKEAGTRRFDVGGLDPALTPPGVLRFKEGLGAAPYRLAAELESADGGVLARLVRWRVRAARAAA